MKLRYLFLSDHAEVAPDGRLNLLGADFDTFYAPVLPVLVPFFYIVGKVRCDPEEFGVEAPFEIWIVDPDGNPLEYTRVNGRITGTAPNDPAIPGGAGLLILMQNCLFPQFGIYRVVLRLGDQEAERLAFKVQMIGQQP
jgi:hypothetical protein